MTGSKERRPEMVLYIDGASRGNPGMAGAGVLMINGEGKRVEGISRYLGKKTNNEAEYWALLLGLREARRRGAESVHVFTDSELVEKQIKGVYRVNHPNLKPLHRKVSDVLKAFSSFRIDSVPREGNREADRLANEAIERRLIKERGGSRRGRDGRSSVSGGEESPSSTGQGGP